MNRFKIEILCDRCRMEVTFPLGIAVIRLTLVDGKPQPGVTGNLCNAHMDTFQRIASRDRRTLSWAKPSRT